MAKENEQFAEGIGAGKGITTSPNPFQYGYASNWMAGGNTVALIIAGGIPDDSNCAEGKLFRKRNFFMVARPGDPAVARGRIDPAGAMTVAKAP